MHMTWLEIRLLSVVLVASTLVSPTLGATSKEVDDRIKGAVKRLYGVQSNGNWERVQVKPVLPPGHSGSGENEGQWGGMTALVTYALLASGEKPTNEKIIKAVEFLRTANITGNYALGMRANVWLNLPDTPANKQALLRDYRLLQAGLSKFPANLNFHDYQAGGKRLDISCAQYGVLGLWAVAQRMPELPPQMWLGIDQAWRKQQGDEGAWGYNGKPRATDKAGSTGSATVQMTAAGVATLFITQEFVRATEGIDGTRGNPTDSNIKRGLEWITANYPGVLRDINYYAMYGVERVGVASGFKYFGTIDWFQSGAEAILKRSGPDARFGNNQDAAWAILFLSRGRAPVMANKLQYNITLEKDGKSDSREANWNQRPRDVANATRWADVNIERKLNWQIINLSVANISDLHDSSILYISGNQKLSFTDKEKAMLKQYVEEGGLIIANADVGKAEFANSVRALGKEFFPEYEFQSLAEHPLMTSQNFPARLWKRQLKVEGVTNGSRLLMVLLPNADISRALQSRDTNRLPEAFQFFANAFLYSVDKTGARYKGETFVVRPDPSIVPTRTIKLARLKYSGRWNPEPGGWKRFAAVLQNENKVKLDISDIDLASPAALTLKDYKIAHITGTSKVSFNETQRLALRDYIAGGGLLVVDACGGSSDFDASMQAELTKMFPTDAVQLASALKREHVFFSSTPLLPEPRYRSFAMERLGSALNRYQLKGITINGKLGVLYSSEDISTGLVGNPIDGVVGYEPSVATALMKRIVLLKSDGKI